MIAWGRKPDRHCKKERTPLPHRYLYRWGFQPPQHLLLAAAAYELPSLTPARHPDLIKVVAVSIPPKQQELQSIGTPPPAGSLVRASLITPLDSATTKHEAPVQAVVSKPLFDGDRLILPQGTLLHGSVLQVRPARRLKHNGELRMAFHQLELPNGSTFRVDTTIEGIQAGTSETLDSEGAAKATNPKSRYINTGIAVTLAMVGSGGKNDVGNAGPAAGGAVAFKLVGIVVGLAVRSHTMAILMSAYGGSRSIYVNFFGPGKNIAFPRDTTMEIGFGSRSRAPKSTHP